MARKGEKAKARKSPDKSPRRVGRPPRRRKKSDSESSEDKKPPEVPPEVEQTETVESGRMRRFTRRQADAAASTSEPKPPQPTEWKEDESFWSKDDAENPKVEERGREDEGSASMWKVQTSNGSGGEIQKLRICRQRPGGAGSDSADSSMSPAKESSPIHKRSLKRESQKSPLVEGEIELPTTSSSTECQDSSLPNQASGVDDMPESSSSDKIVQYVYETQPSIQSIDTSPTPQVNESDTPSETQEKSKSPVQETSEPQVAVVEIVRVEPESVQVENPEATKASNIQVQEMVSDDKNNEENVKLESKEDTNEHINTGSSETDSSSVEKKDEKVKESDKKNDDKSEESVKDVKTTTIDKSVAEASVKNSETEKSASNVEQVSTEESTDKITDVNKTENENSDSPPDLVNTRQTVTITSRRKSDSSVKSGGSRRSSISLPASANSESNEPLLEISVNKSPIHEGKEEGEIIEDEKSDIQDAQDQNDKRNLKFKSKTDEAARGKIIINRRSTNDSTSSETSKSASTTPATTAKKHPLITGPEPDESPAVRRRKLSVLTTTRTVITPGGTTRQVRSIPGEALKAVLLPESEKKEKEKRPRSSIKTKEETVESGGGDNIPTNESMINKIDDVREILKNNRAVEKRNSDRDKEVKSSKSPAKTISVIEVKASTRKVSIGTALLVEEVKAIKPPRSKSPGDSKATPILFITNLVRPFTAGQLKELLARTGTIASNGFFIDKIKSKCFVKYVDVEMAIETRHALNGVRWPVSNPKVLKVAYAYENEMKAIQESAEGEVVDDLSATRGSGWLSSEQAASKDKEKRKAAAPTTREWDRGKPKTGAEGDVIFIDEYRKEEKLRQAAAIKIEVERNEKHREKVDKVVKEEQSRNHSQSERDRDRKKRRSTPVETENSPPPPARKFKKKDYDAPAKLLDDLFRKTKTNPCLYWLPLSTEQIAEKEETRRMQMVKHEKKMAEIKKSAQERRDRERDRDRERRRK